MRTKLKVIILLSLSCASLLQGCQQGKYSSWQKLVIGEWKTENSTLTPRGLEFRNNSTARFAAPGDSAQTYKYFMKEDTVFLEDSKGSNKKLHIANLTNDSLTIDFLMMGSYASFDYYRVK
jgi:hypothetical protein